MEFVYFPCIVIGSGMAGLTASIYLSEASISCLVIEGNQIGGALVQSDSVRNWPGMPNESGKEIVNKVRNQAKQTGAELFSTEAQHVDISNYRPLFRVRTRDPHPIYHTNLFLTQTLVVATGSTFRKLGIPGERELWGKGIFSCAICESSLVRDATVAVVGGGDSAIAKALYLVPLVKKLFLIVRSNRFCAKDVVRMKQLLSFTEGAKPKVTVLLNTRVIKVDAKTTEQGRSRLGAIQLKNREKQWTQPVDALFLAIGIIPNTELFPTLVKRPDGTLQTFRYQETSQPGVFCCGDVCDSMFRQAITAAGQGAQSAIQIKSFLDERSTPAFAAKGPSLVRVGNSKQPEILTLAKEVHKRDSMGTRATSCKSEICSPRNIYQQSKKQVVVDTPSEDSSEDSPTTSGNITEILSVSDWKRFVAKHPTSVVEVMSSSCFACGSIEFRVRELPHQFPGIGFARIDMELVDPDDLKVLGEELNIPEKIEIPYFAKIINGKNRKHIQGEAETSPAKLLEFLTR